MWRLWCFWRDEASERCGERPHPYTSKGVAPGVPSDIEDVFDLDADRALQRQILWSEPFAKPHAHKTSMGHPENQMLKSSPPVRNPIKFGVLRRVQSFCV